MYDILDDRIFEEAQYLIDNNCTIREVAAQFEISKSTVHKDISERLRELDSNLYLSAKAVLEHNFAVRHIRGGESTKLHYLEKAKKIEQKIDNVK